MFDPTQWQSRMERLERLERIFHTVSDMAVLIGVEEGGFYRCLEANRAVADTEGISLDRIVGRRIDEIHPPAAYVEWKAIYDRVVREGRALEIEHEVEGPQGRRHRITRFHPLFDAEGHCVQLLGVCRDITEEKKAREEVLRHLRDLEEQKALFEAILHGVNQGISAQAPDGSLVFANRAFAEIAGYASPEALLNAPLAARRNRYEVRNEEGRLLDWSELPGRKALQGEPGPRQVLRMLDRELGIERWVNAKSTAVFGEEGGVKLAINFAEDVTELREKEAAVRSLERLDSLGKLAGGIAHDFNNLLVAIIGYSDMGSRMAEGQPVLEEFFREILKSGQRAASLTQQLLAYSRKQIVMPKPLSLNDLVTDMERMLRRLIGEHIDLSTALMPSLPLIKADPGQLQQVLLNLLVNARDALEGGGRIVIGTAVTAVERGRPGGVPGLVPGEYAVLTVSDDGAGMPPEVRERIFEPFFTTKPVGKGTGLGLSSVYGIVKQSGGHIEVKSEPGAGSVFTLYFPAETAEALQNPPDSDPESGKGSETVLLVEDEEPVRNFARKVLENLGYSVLAAGDGVEALRKAGDSAGPIHVLLTDVVMPQMGGTVLAERFRKEHPETRTVFMSGYTDDQVVAQGLLEGEVHFLRKPFSTAELGRKIREALEGARPSR